MMYNFVLDLYSLYFYNIFLENVSEDFAEDTYIQQLQFSAKINIQYIDDSDESNTTENNN